MRKEVIGRHTLYCGDCLEIMPTLSAQSIDIVLTDPPYLLINADWDKELDIESVIENIERLLSDNSAFVFFGRGDSFYKWNILANRFSKFKEEIIWDKTKNNTPMMALMRQHETISIRTRGARKINKSYVEFVKRIIEKEKMHLAINYIKVLQSLAKRKPEAVLNFLRTKKIDCDARNNSRHKEITFKNMKPNRSISTLKQMVIGSLESSIISLVRDNFHTSDHPTQKPLELIQRLLNLVKRDADLVCDMFMGSGTTLVACETLGLTSIGIEKEEKYFDAACKRVEKAVRENSLNDKCAEK